MKGIPLYANIVRSVQDGI